MEITVNEYKRVTVVTVSGRVDSVTYGEFESALQAELEQGRVNMVLDFSGVEFISSAGLRVLVNARKLVKNAGGRIAFAQPRICPSHLQRQVHFYSRQGQRLTQ